MFPILGIKVHYFQISTFSFNSGPSAEVPTWKSLLVLNYYFELAVASLNSCPCVEVPNMPKFVGTVKNFAEMCFQNFPAGLNLRLL